MEQIVQLEYHSLPTLIVRMRDRVGLSTNVWLPASVGAFPVILMRTPYSITQDEYDRLGLQAYVTAGFAVVMQMVRGLGGSGGSFRFFHNEGNDGYDTVEWIARQSWSNGKIGMDGASYLGTVQWLAAREQPPHLSCIAPSVPAGDFFNEIPYTGGALQVDWAFSWLTALQGKAFEFEDQGHMNLEAFRPLNTVGEKLGADMSVLTEILEHQTFDDYWKNLQFSADDFTKIDIPVFTVTGWFDGDQPGSLFYWQGLSDCNKLNRTRPHEAELTIGPWNHSECYLGGQITQQDMMLGENSIIPIQQERVEFFKRHLLPDCQEVKKQPSVKLYITGTNEWIRSDAYPLTECNEKRLFLDSYGTANTAAGGGQLQWQKPLGNHADRFEYDPKYPVPYKVAATDHAEIEMRSDVLVYTGEVLTKGITVIGQPQLVLYAASDAFDTDFTAKLLDVCPDGRAISLTHVQGVLRARYRDGMQEERLLTPGKPERFVINLAHIGHSFLPGHQMRLEVSSSCFPYADPNPNTGGNISTETSVQIAAQTIYHQSDMPSHLLLPIYSKA